MDAAQPLQSEASTPPAVSLDHLICAGEKGGWKLKSDFPCRANVEDEIELRRLLDRDLGGARSTKEPINLVSDSGPMIGLVRGIGHEPAPPDVLA
jgi:hypothetical protein